MARPLLPPYGVYICSGLIYRPNMPAPVYQTYSQLRGLAWGETISPPLRMQELVKFTHKSQATIYQHMSQLRNMGVLSWRTTGPGTIIMSFVDVPLVGDHMPKKPYRKPRAHYADWEQLNPPLPEDGNDTPTQDGENEDSDSLESPASAILESQNHVHRVVRPDSEADSEVLESQMQIDSEVSESQTQIDSEDLESKTGIDSESSEFLSSKSLINKDNNKDINKDNINKDININLSFPLNPLNINYHHEDKDKKLLINPPHSGGEEESEAGTGILESRNEIVPERENLESLERSGDYPPPVLSSDVLSQPSDAPIHCEAVSVYTELTGLVPDPPGAVTLLNRVTDLTLWRQSLEHWLWHHWNPKNIAGMLTLYARGGEPGCFICDHGEPIRRKRFSSPESAPSPTHNPPGDDGR